MPEESRVRPKVTDIMTRIVAVVPPDVAVREVAARMRDQNVGCLPVCDSGSVVGMITDRDLALRVYAVGRNPDSTMVQDVMSREIISCEPGDRLDDVLELMGRWKVRRIPVLSNDGQLVGLVTLGKTAGTDWACAGEVVGQILEASPVAGAARKRH